MATSQTITIRQPTVTELEAVRQLRHAVLDPDQNQPTELTLSATDHNQSTVHMGAFDGDMVVSTARLQPLTGDPQVYLVRKVATDQAYRGQGLAAKVLAAAETEAVNRGAKAFVLDARPKAKTLYERAGYWITGSRTMHDGIEDIGMAKQVKI